MKALVRSYDLDPAAAGVFSAAAGPVGTLSVAERDELRGLEATVALGVDATLKAVQALERIREGRLYRESHATFEEYVRQKWGRTARSANQLIGWLDVDRSLAALPADVPRPANESQARPLAGLAVGKREEAARVVKQTLADRGEASATAKDWRDAGDRVRGKAEGRGPKAESEIASERWERAKAVNERQARRVDGHWEYDKEEGELHDQGRARSVCLTHVKQATEHIRDFCPHPFGATMYFLGCAEKELDRIGQELAKAMNPSKVHRGDAKGAEAAAAPYRDSVLGRSIANGEYAITRVRNHFRWLTPGGGWTKDKDKGKRFEDSAAAAAWLRGRPGKVVRL